MVLLLVDMVAEADEILIILESDDSLALYFGQWKQIFENVRDSLPKSRVKVIENKMREGFTHWIHLIF